MNNFADTGGRVCMTCYTQFNIRDSQDCPKCFPAYDPEDEAYCDHCNSGPFAVDTLTMVPEGQICPACKAKEGVK